MLITNPLLLSQIPAMICTFGANATLFSPIFNLLLIAAAILILIALFKNNTVRNIFAGFGFVGLMNYLFSSNDRTPSHQSNIFGHHSQPYSRSTSFHTHYTQPANFFSSPIHQHHSSPSSSYPRHFHGHC